jgi:hypothetical protein
MAWSLISAVTARRDPVNDQGAVQDHGKGGINAAVFIEFWIAVLKSLIKNSGREISSSSFVAQFVGRREPALSCRRRVGNCACSARPATPARWSGSTGKRPTAWR